MTDGRTDRRPDDGKDVRSILLSRVKMICHCHFYTFGITCNMLPLSLTVDYVSLVTVYVVIFDSVVVVSYLVNTW